MASGMSGKPLFQAFNAPASQLIILPLFVAAGSGMGIRLVTEPVESFGFDAH